MEAFVGSLWVHAACTLSVVLAALRTGNGGVVCLLATVRVVIACDIATIVA